MDHGRPNFIRLWLLSCIAAGLGICGVAVAQSTNPAKVPPSAETKSRKAKKTDKTEAASEKPSSSAAEKPAEEESALQKASNQLKVPFFFDSRRTSFTRDGKKQLFEGEVVAIATGVLLSADRLTVDQERGVVEASGHIVLLSQQQVLTGESMTYIIATGDFVINDAVMSLSDPIEAAKIQQRVLGFSPEELAFEADRAAKLSDLESRKSRMRDVYRDLKGSGMDPPESFFDQYALLLEQGDVIQDQENPVLSRLGEERRNGLKRRRGYWDSSRAKGLVAPINNISYFKLAGSTIERTNGNDYLSRSAVWTPCLCDEDENPDWGFRSERVEAQVGGYADLYHAVLEIKGFPVLYLPYVKIPIKDRRQSGFLLPSVVEDLKNKSGVIYSQPVFFDLGPSADSTMTVDTFERRGTRLGAEFRIKQRKSTGWTLGIEGIRDRIWMRERALHDDLSDMYRLGLDEARMQDRPARTDPVPVDGGVGPFVAELKRRSYWDLGGGLAECVGNDPDARKSCEQRVFTNFEVPSNAWRGKATWKGVSYIASRLSLVSSGAFVSDHRYASELYVPNDLTAVVFGGRYASTYTPAKARVHLDSQDLYASVGSSFGDNNFLMNERFKGAHTPGYAVAQSRMVELDPRHRFIVPVYAQVSGEGRRILDYLRTETIDNDTEAGKTYLGSGLWQRGSLKTVAPIVSERIVTVDHFSDLETRQIEHSGLDRKTSSIRSWRTGLRFQLPIDGKGEVPGFLQPEPDPLTGAAHKRFAHHIMNWAMTLSARPSVIRRGPYAEDGDSGSNGVTYYVSDRKGGGDDGTSAEKIMAQHQRVSFSTSHIWRAFDEGWQILPGAPPKKVAKGDTKEPETASQETALDAPPLPEHDDSQERARRELLYSLDRPVTDELDMMQGQDFLINRYRLQKTNSHDVVSFNAGIGYDYLKAGRREEIRKQRRDIESGAAPGNLADVTDLNNEDVRPWDPAEINLSVYAFSLSLSNSMTYNVYDRVPTRLDFALSFPTIFQTSTAVGYEILTAVTRKDGEVYLDRTRTRRASAVTSLIPRLATTIDYRTRVKDSTDGLQEYQTGFGFLYSPPSKCWQLQLARTKDFTTDELNASYFLQLNVVFMGQARSLPNMSPQVTRQIRDET